MANPNIVSVTSILGVTTYAAVTTTEVSVLAAAATGHVLKVNEIIVSNVTATAATVTVSVHSAAALGGTAYRMCYQLSVPGNASLIVSDKSTAFYIGEAQSIGATAGTVSALECVISYEDIS